jgi:DNA-binding transcriptional MerR regulator
MRIGELCKATGVPIQTLRFYERKALLRQPPRTAGGYRCYNETDIAQVRFIRDAQELGFTLKEIRALSQIHAPSQRPSAPRWPEAFRIARERLALIDRKIAQLQAFRQKLAAGLNVAAKKNGPICPASVSAVKSVKTRSA